MSTPNPNSFKSRFLTEKFNTISIRRKLILLSTSSVLLALIVAFTAIAIFDVNFFRKAKVEQLDSQAKMLAFNCVGVLTFQDSEATGELLQSMSMYPAVDYASVTDQEGTVLAEYFSNRVKNLKSASADAKTDLSEKQLGSESGIEIVKPVKDGGETIGYVRILANTEDFREHLRSYFYRAGIILLLTMAGATLYGRFVQGSISGPINRLANAARTVRDQQDYSVRVDQESKDELGELASTFNQMLEMIQTSKAELHRANNELESRVKDRTSQLTNEIETRKRAQEELEQAIVQAEASNRAKSDFLANMSHEIRTPLNGILGFADLLCDARTTISPETQQDYLQTISSSGRHLLELINDILDLSKIEAGQLAVEIAPVSPHQVANQVVSVLRSRAQAKGLDLTCEWKSKVPELIFTDGGRLRQLLMNLVGNAIKFTHHGSVSILMELDQEKEKLIVSVKDTGIGIAPEKQASIFDPFVQADNSVTRQYGGTGLGLAISSRIAKALHGQVTVNSEEGKGSTFQVEIETGSLVNIPLLDSPPTDALNSSANTEDVDSIDLTGSRILLVEDGKINRKLISLLLEEIGASVQTAENGWVGMQMAEQNEYDMIVMDMQMPVMDGYTATSKLRDAGCELPILALTAHAMKGDEDKCLAAGCTSFLSKPVDREKLIQTIADCLGIEPNSDSLDGQDTVLENGVENDSIRSNLPLDNPVYQQIVEEFVDFLSNEMNQMEEAFDRGNLELLAQIAHGLKGAGGTAGFPVLTSPAAKLQQCSPESTEEEIKGLLQELRTLTNRIVSTEQVNV